MVEAMMRTTSLSDVSHVDRVEDEDRNDGHHNYVAEEIDT